MQEFGRILEEFKKRGGVVMSNTPVEKKKPLCPLNINCKKVNTSMCDMNCLDQEVKRAKGIED